jgi:VCBS repeat protein
VVDLNRDGVADVLVATNTGSIAWSLAVALGDGQGGYRRTAYDTLFGLPRPVVADVDGDGWLDVVLPRPASCGHYGCVQGGYVVFFGSPSGALRGEARLPDLDVVEVAVADVDGDAVPDFALHLSDGSLAVALGDGTGGFGTIANLGFIAAATVEGFTAADVDGDGRADLVAQSGTWQLASRRGRGDGTFDAATFTPIGGLSALADVTEDGVPDAVVLGPVGFSVHAAQRGVGFVPWPSMSIAGQPDSLALADVNEDGFADGMTSSRLQTYPLASDVFLSDGLGAFSATASPLLSSLKALGDLSGDGHADVVMQSQTPGSVELSFGNGDGTFRSGPRMPTGISLRSSSFDDLRLIDVDGDGSLELLAAGITARVLRWNGTGLDGAPPFTPLRTPGTLATADLDGDGRMDLVAVESEIAYREPGRLSLWHGDGAGGFAPVGGDLTLPRFARMALPADVDEDGRLDLVIVVKGECYWCPTDVGGVFVARGNGDGTVRTPERVFGDYGLESAAVADLDGDGHLDVATAGLGHVVLLRGDGHGSFQSAATYAGPTIPPAIVAEDLEHDGDVDLLVLDPYGHGVWLLKNRTVLPHLDARRGNVNVAAGSIVDVLRVNASAGEGRARRLVLDRTTPIEIRMDAPPSAAGGRAPFVLWDWVAVPTIETVTRLPGGLGLVPMPTPLARRRSPQPRFVANNLGHDAALGHEHWPIATSAAPSVLLRLPNGLRRPVTFYLQGLILDSAGPNGTSAVTNGIEVIGR